MTYREIAIQMKDDDSEHILLLVGDWIGNEGQRALSFPDAEPLDFDSNSMWEPELYEYLLANGVEF